MKFQLGRMPCKVTVEKDRSNTDEKKDTPFAQVGLVQQLAHGLPTQSDSYGPGKACLGLQRGARGRLKSEYES